MITRDVQAVIEFKRALLQNKWSIECILVLGDGDPLRFNEIHDNLPGCSAKVLTQTLKRMETQQLVIRISYNEVPPKVTYRLSKTGLPLLAYIENSLEYFSKAYKLYMISNV
jgi:DNA-binding HxlR family transcriptional regulator